jgi:hypothetical protein
MENMNTSSYSYCQPGILDEAQFSGFIDQNAYDLKVPKLWSSAFDRSSGNEPERIDICISELGR